MHLVGCSVVIFFFVIYLGTVPGRSTYGESHSSLKNQAGFVEPCVRMMRGVYLNEAREK